MGIEVKPPEEGMLWEWRAFGPIDEGLARRIQDHPIRLGILNQPEEDTYLISPLNDQNVKLRNYSNGSVLKLKLLFATGPDSIELYNESATYVHRFPISQSEMQQATRLLQVKLGKTSRTLDSFTPQQFVRALAESSPPVFAIDVRKTRTQYAFPGAWIEIADVFFPHGQVQTVSIQSPGIEAVQNLLKQLSPGHQLEVMNYVEACRRWA